ncbi:MAG: anthranilate phosphoribosyltransferase [Verrucomicrobiales bacterium]|nr:anthranilate phosphoribosyltransferase [Verrucomicrobiales bacterium]
MAQSRPLSDEQVAEAVAALTDEEITAEEKAAFLVALAGKGETSAEIAAFARELRGRSIVPPLDPETRQREILDVCGTGGDRLNTFNISTTVALIVAAAGVTVAKHGNRAITSQAGSADVLEELGVRIDLSPADAAHSLRERRFAFFFAPRYHPAFKHIGPARKLCAERGQRTIFNFLGPLLNPARPTAQLVGVPLPQLCEPIARVLQMLGVRRAMVVSGQVRSEEVKTGMSKPNNSQFSILNSQSSFLDELSTLGDNTIAEFYQDRAFSLSTLAPAAFAFQPAGLADLAGGDRLENARIVLALLEGKERGPKRDAVLLNAGAALFVGGQVRSQLDGIDLAAELIDSGSALAKLRELRE